MRNQAAITSLPSRVHATPPSCISPPTVSSLSPADLFAAPISADRPGATPLHSPSCSSSTAEVSADQTETIDQEHTPTRLSPALTVSEASPPLARSALENCTESVNSTPSSSESSGSLSSTTASWFAPSLASVCGASATRQLAASKKADAPAHNPRRCRPRLADTITQKSSA